VHRYGFPLPEVLARATIAIELVGRHLSRHRATDPVWSGLVTLQMLLIVAKVKCTSA